MDNKQCNDNNEFFKLEEEFFTINKAKNIGLNQVSQNQKYSKKFYLHKNRKKLNKFILMPFMVLLLTTIFIKESIETVTSRNIVIYVVQKGDTLWDISSEYLGSSLRYLQIAKENNISNPNLIYPNDMYAITVTKTTKYKNGVIVEETIH